MKRIIMTAAALVLCLAACKEETMKPIDLKPIPDAAYAKGVSAPFCGVTQGVLMVAGGANFPDKSLLEGGAKRVYADIWAKAPSDGEWVHAGVLPDSTAYGATFAVDSALILAGGNVCGVTTDRVYELRLCYGKAVLRALPQLPVPMEQCGWTRDGDRLYLVGGVGTAGVYACTIGDYVWSKVADLPEPLVQPVAFASSGRLFVWGGFNPETLEVSDKGLCLDLPAISGEGSSAAPGEGSSAVSGGDSAVISGEGSSAVSGEDPAVISGEGLSAVAGEDPAVISGEGSSAVAGGGPAVISGGAEGGVGKSSWREAPGIPDGGTFVGATGTTLPDGRLVVLGGVNRAIFARALHNTPEDRIPYLSKEPAEYQFRQDVFVFDPAAEAWTLLGTVPACALAGPGLAVTPASPVSGTAAVPETAATPVSVTLYVAGGELKPGVRSPRIFSLAL